jgi:hypothetical protein
VGVLAIGRRLGLRAYEHAATLRHDRLVRLSGWSKALDLEDLRDLTALWLEGSVSAHPAYYGRPDPETATLVPVLAEANRAGYLTVGSQPGDEESLAAVEGFCDDVVAPRLTAVARSAGLDVCCTQVRARRRYRDLGPGCVFGSVPSRQDVGVMFLGCPARLVRQLRHDAHFVVIVATEGRRERLWDTLREWSSATLTAQAGRC